MPQYNSDLLAQILERDGAIRQPQLNEKLNRETRIHFICGCGTPFRRHSLTCINLDVIVCHAEYQKAKQNTRILVSKYTAKKILVSARKSKTKRKKLV